MMRLSTKAIVILAAVCFLGLVILQVAWMRSAYEGELALYNKAKKQFEADLQAELGRNQELKTGLKDFIDHYNQFKSVGETQEGWFHFKLVQAIDFTPQKPEFGMYLDGISIVQHHHTGNSTPKITTLATNSFDRPDVSQIREAGKLCIHCILGLKEDAHEDFDYQILLFYKDRLPAFFERLWLMILGSFILLIVLGLLFRQIVKKFRQEKKLSEAKNDFINNMTHEMQTPVFAIQMANKLIEQKTVEESEIAPLTRIIEKEAAQLKQHAAKILELASLERGQVELSKEMTELNALIRQRRPTIELMLETRQGELTMNLSVRPLNAELDQVHFNNILVSLADNAIKYNDGVPHITIETGETDNMVYLRFSDNGIGIRREYLPYVMDKFFRVPHAKRNGIAGLGLGLSYVKHIVELHNGEVKIASEEGKGTTVTILVPKAMARE